MRGFGDDRIVWTLLRGSDAPCSLWSAHSSDELGDQLPSDQVWLGSSPGTWVLVTSDETLWCDQLWSESWAKSGTNATLPEYLSCFLINTGPTNNMFTITIQTPCHQGPPLFQDKMLSTRFHSKTRKILQNMLIHLIICVLSSKAYWIESE